MRRQPISQRKTGYTGKDQTAEKRIERIRIFQKTVIQTKRKSFKVSIAKNAWPDQDSHKMSPLHLVRVLYGLWGHAISTQSIVVNSHEPQHILRLQTISLQPLPSLSQLEAVPLSRQIWLHPQRIQIHR